MWGTLVRMVGKVPGEPDGAPGVVAGCVAQVWVLKCGVDRIQMG